MSKRVGARSGNVKKGRSAERFLPPDGPHINTFEHMFELGTVQSVTMGVLDSVEFTKCKHMAFVRIKR